MTKASKAMRFFFFNAATIILIGIWLTGFDKVHWFLYAVPVFFLFAAAVGICPGLIMAQKIFGKDRKLLRSARRMTVSRVISEGVSPSSEECT